MKRPDDSAATSRMIQQKFAPAVHGLWMRSRTRSWQGVPRLIGELWRLHLRGYLASCVMWTTPDGFELRLIVDFDPEPGGNRCHSGAAFVPLVELALEWKKQFQEQGWA